MSDGVGEVVPDECVSKLIEARGRPAVLKFQLAKFRASHPHVVVFVFEGDDDKIAYAQWVRRICPKLRYEPFPCGGKAEVLRLKDAAVRDKSDLLSGVYFFVDRDFDDLSGHESHSQLFMTDRYSVENYLVTKDVLSSLLTNEFHCHARPDVRDPIVGRFGEIYGNFLSITKELNWRIYVHRSKAVPLETKLPRKASHLAEISASAVAPRDPRAECAVPLPKDLGHDELNELREQFELLDPEARYRGKFALLFFRRWLEELAKECNTADGGAFSGLPRTGKVRERELVLSNFASLACEPEGLSDFLRAVKGPEPVAA